MSQPPRVAPTTDAEWLSLAEPMVRHVVRRWAFDPHDRADLAQLCRLGILETRPEFDPREQEWSTFVFRTCDACCRNARRKESRRAKLCRQRGFSIELDDNSLAPQAVFHTGGIDTASWFSTDDAADPLVIAARSERRALVLAAVARLDAVSRKLVRRMYGLDGRRPTLTIVSTAERFDLSVGETKRIVGRALAQIQDFLTETVPDDELA